MEKSLMNYKQYEAAVVHRDTTWRHTIKFSFFVLLDVIRVLALFVPNCIRSVFRLFCPQAKKSIQGQTALVSGGGNGIGRAIALSLAKQGCNVAVVDVDINAAETTSAELCRMNVKSTAYRVDISDPQAIASLQFDVERDLGPVDILVNNAGLLPTLFYDQGSNDDIERVIKVNMISHLYTIRQFLPSMIDRKRGHIVAIASISAVHALPRAVAYTASKFGIDGIMRALSEELRYDKNASDIQLTTAYPYFVATRKDVMDVIKLRFPPIDPEDAGHEIVEAILHNKVEVFVPGNLALVVKLLYFMSTENNRLIRDYIMREGDSVSR